MKHILRSSALAVLLLAALPAAQAAVQNYDFAGTLDSGVFNGQSFAGNFSFDDASNATLDFNGAAWFSVSTMNLSFLGNSYTAQNGDVAPEVAFYNGALLGLSYSFSAGDPQIALVAATPGDPAPAFLAYDTALGASGAGSISYTAAVPEPESYAMFLAGLGLMGLLARRRSKHV